MPLTCSTAPGRASSTPLQAPATTTAGRRPRPSPAPPATAAATTTTGAGSGAGTAAGGGGGGAPLLTTPRAGPPPVAAAAQARASWRLSPALCLRLPVVCKHTQGEHAQVQSPCLLLRTGGSGGAGGDAWGPGAHGECRRSFPGAAGAWRRCTMHKLFPFVICRRQRWSRRQWWRRSELLSTFRCCCTPAPHAHVPAHLPLTWLH